MSIQAKELIENHPLFQGLNTDEINALIATCCFKNYVYGEQLFLQGEPASNCYLIIHGHVAIESKIPDVEPVNIQTIEKGDILGWSWLFPPYTWHFDARAIDSTSTLVLSGKALHELIKENKSTGLLLMTRFSSIMMARLQETRLQLLNLYGSFQLADIVHSSS